ncbi:MAG: hypothetical protein HZA46_19720 [Planctomycetales bacterium]|nr:hypothetical protein [Planctomycetales bacterium]
MANLFVRVDLSNTSRDFEFMVLDAGVPLLDPRGAHFQILRKWLKGQVAEPELKGQQVGFYVRSDGGARMENVRCVPVSEADLDGPLRKEFETLVAGIQKAEAKTRDEEAVLRVAREELLSLTTQQKKRLRCSYLFKYQDLSKAWRLVWCVGYRRKDMDPSPPHICRNPNCQHLFVKRANNPKCPICQAPTDLPETDTRKTASSFPWKSLAFLILLAVGGWFGWQKFGPQIAGLVGPGVVGKTAVGLVVSPETWSGPVGSRIEFTVTDNSQGGKIVTRDAVPQSSDRKVIEIDDLTLQAHAKSPGKATIEFKVGQQTRQVTITVEPPSDPDKLTLEPASVSVGIGTTARLKLMGTYKDGRRVDLTEAAEWLPSSGKSVFLYRGLIEGLREGDELVRARYRATPKSEPMDAAANVVVQVKKFTELALRLDPLSVAVGQVAEINASVKTDTGETLSVSESSHLTITLDPPDAGTHKDGRVYAKKLGSLKIIGKFQGLEDAVALEISGEQLAKVSQLTVQPTSLDLAVGEIADLSITAPKTDPPVRIVPDGSGIVQKTDDNRLVGRTEGTASVVVSQGDATVTVAVTVKKVTPKSIKFIPDSLTVRVDDSMGLRIVGELDNQRTFELAPDVLDWTSFPRPDFASLNKTTLRVKGLKGTGSDHERLAVRFAGLDASANLQVVSGPLQLELTPGKSIEVPVGQKQPLQVWASYGDGQREEIAADRVEWKWEPIAGLILESGNLHAEQPDVGPLKLSVVYQGVTSNEVEVKSVASVPLALKIVPKPDRLPAGQAGAIDVTGASPAGAVPISDRGVTFESSDPNVVTIDANTGAFLANQPGTAKITAKLTTGGDPAEAEVTVFPAAPEPAKPKTKSVRIVTDQPKPVRVPVGAEFTDFKVEAIDESDAVHDVTAETLANLTFDGDPAELPLALRDGRLIGTHPGDIKFTASYDGVEATEPLPIIVVAELDVDEIRVTPATVKMAVGETAGLSAEGFLKGRSVGVLTDHPGIVWKARESGEPVLQLSGSLVTGVRAGQAGVTAQVGSIVSSVADVTVVDSADGIAEPLVVSPERLRMQVGESRVVGSDVKVTRGGVDLSSQAEVSPANRRVVVFQPDQRTLVASAPGRSRVTYSAGGQLVHQDVEVVPAEPAAPGSRVQIEPNGGVLAVGERLNVRGYQFCEPCGQRRTGRTSSLALTSSDPSVCTVDGHTLVGMKPGQVQITGRLPGIVDTAQATFTVVDTDVKSLVIVPPRSDLAPGQRKYFQVYAVTPTGRRLLGDHPDLKLTLEGPEPNAVELQAGARALVGAIQGRAQLVARWRDSSEAQIPVVVSGEPIRELRIDPPTGPIATRDTHNFQVFGRRGPDWVPLDTDDGVTLRSADPTYARVAQGGLQAEALRPGVARIVANYRNLRAETQLTVTTASTPAAPPGRPIGLRFGSDLVRVTKNSNGESFRVLRVDSDGREEDVGHLATMTIRDPQGVIAIDQTAAGPVLRPRQLGQTQVDAALGNLRTTSPMLVDVVDTLPGQAWVSVTPNPLRLEVGDTQPVGRVLVHPRGGGQPFELPYRLSASQTPLFDVDSQRKTITGQRDGTATAIATITDPSSPYDGLPGNLTVEVGTPAQAAAQSAVPQLVLNGPVVTTIGAEIDLQVERVQGTTGRTVTSEAGLSIPDSERDLAELRPGCRLLAKRAGTVHVEARHGGLVSNVHEVRIQPSAVEFERLVLTLDAAPLTVGERRDHEIWGYPRGGGPRQDLTGQITDDPTRLHLNLTVVAPDPTTSVVTHRAPHIIGSNPGRVRVEAAIGNRLRSDVVDLTVVAQAGNQPYQLRVEPQTVVLREGERTPEYRVLVRSRGATTFREVDNARLESLDSNVLAPISDDHRRFTAVRPGPTKIRATFGDLSDTGDVRVSHDRFRRIIPGEPQYAPRGRREFALELDVRTSPSAERIEYRVLVPGVRAESPWVQATRKGEEMSATLKTPMIPKGPNSEIYRLRLEAREVGSHEVEPYPFSFQIKESLVERRE